MSASFSVYRQVICNSGEATCVPLPVPHRGVLSRLIVKQTDGTLDGFAADVYDREENCPPIPSEPVPETDPLGEEGETEVVFDSEVHKVIDTLTAASSAASVALFGGGSAYENKDVPASNRCPVNRLYLSLVPEGTDTDKIFHIGITVVSNIL